MSTSELSFLKGKKIHVIRRVHDYIQILFSGGDILNIYNDTKIELNNNIKIGDVIDADILSISRMNEEEKLEITGVSIIIRMSDDAFHGPEAMSFIAKSGQITIFG
ncbi:MAG: hypothetical protein O9338_18255 [Microcystis sp. LE19-251.1A]|nr:hypothetical protein [Microcystis sp. LE19-251.1A]